MVHWTDFGVWQADDIHWDRFEPSLVDSDLVMLIKAASLVEHNAPVYAKYLCNVFHDDPDFAKLAKDWADEEVKHGKTLAHYAKLAHPDFDFDDAFKRFTEGFQVPVDVSESVRGSLTGEILDGGAVVKRISGASFGTHDLANGIFTGKQFLGDNLSNHNH